MANDRAPSLRRDFARARSVDPEPITGRQSPRELLASAFPAFVGRQVRTAYDLMMRTFAQDCTTFLTISGAMTPAGLHQSCVLPLLRRGLVHCLTTTGANLYHDAHRIIGHAVREVSPDAGDLRLRMARIIRIYDLGFWEEALLDTDRLFTALLQKPAFQRRLTTAELHFLLGKELAAMEKALGVERPSLLSSCYRHGVPIFVGAVQDGSIFLNVVKLRKLLGDAFRLDIDIAADVYAMGALQHYARHHFSKRLAVWILGGGVPKNYTLQGEPLLSQILNVPTPGFDIDVQICVDPVDNGALSSCPAGEGHTWGKVTGDFASSSVYVHCDVTAVFPWLTHALLSDPRVKHPHRRLMDHLPAALGELDRAVEGQRRQLMKTLSFPGVGRAQPDDRAKRPRAGV